MCFFIAGEDALERSVLDIVALEHSQLHGHSDAVVCPERGAFGFHPIAVYITLDGIFGEVEFDVDEFVAHHIGMALQDHRLSIFVARCGRFSNDDIVRGIDIDVEPMLLGELFQIGHYLLLVFRGTRNLINLFELLENTAGGQVAFTHFYFLCLVIS